MARTSNHYRQDRKDREEAIQRIGEGTVVYNTVVYHEQKKRYFYYEITDNAILIVKDMKTDFIITKLIARVPRIKQYWADAPQEILDKAREHTIMGLTF